MPNRILRDGINDSRSVCALSDSGEIFYRRLMSLVDDYGRYDADPEVLRGKLFCRMLDRWPLERVQEALSEVSAGESPLVSVYQNNKFLQINNFKQAVRSKQSKWPAPDEHLRSTCVADAERVSAYARASSPTPTTSSTSNQEGSAEGNLREFPKPQTSPRRVEPQAGDSVSQWAAAGFEDAEDAETWWQALLRKHPNRGRNAHARGVWLEQVMAGQFDRTEFERWYQEQIPTWADWAQRNIQAPNLHAVFSDAAWRFPAVELVSDGMSSSMRKALEGL